MRLECALLCDAASVREGLLHILGGGVSQWAQPSFPSRLRLDPAIRIVFTEEELSEAHRLGARVVNAAGIQLGALALEFEAALAETAGVQEGPLALPITINAELPEAGEYRVEVELDDVAIASLPLEVRVGGPTENEITRPQL